MLNGLFGSGGGIFAVPLLRKTGLSVKEAQATSLFLMLVLSAVSAAIYLLRGQINGAEALGFLPGGVAGAAVAAAVFKRINPAVLKKIFGAAVSFSAAKMLFDLAKGWLFG